MIVLPKIRVTIRALLRLQAFPRHRYGFEFEFRILVVFTVIRSSNNNN